MMTLQRALVSIGAALAFSAHASPLTVTSPTGGTLPSAVSAVGGIVIDLQGSNGVRVTTQAAASSLFIGYQLGSPNLLVGTQTGFTSSVVAALGGGITSASVRVSLFDGDNQVGNFDYQQDGLTLNNVAFGNFSSVATNQTTSTGAFVSASLGFGDNTLDTGWFTVTNAATLANLYSTLSTGKVEFRVTDLTFSGNYTDQYYDFTQGIDTSLVNVGTPPVITMVPEPSTYLLMGAGVAALGLRRRSSRRK